MSIGITSILIIFITFIVYGEIRKWLINRKLRNFESLEQIPILGAAGRFFNKSNDQFIDIIFDLVRNAKTGTVIAWFGPILFFLINEAEDIQIVLTSDDCLNKPYLYEQMNCKTSIIVTDREIWKPHRRALNSCFNVKMLQGFIPQLNEKSRILLQQIEPFLEKPGDLYRSIFIYMIGN